jgi:hypothetical protein
MMEKWAVAKRIYISSGVVLLVGLGVMLCGVLAITRNGGSGTLSNFWSLGFGAVNLAEIINWGQLTEVHPLPLANKVSFSSRLTSHIGSSSALTKHRHCKHMAGSYIIPIRCA